MTYGNAAISHGVRSINNMTDLIVYFSEYLGWEIEVDDFFDLDDVSYDFNASDIGLKEESFAKIRSLRQLQPVVDNQKWGIFCIEFDSGRFEISALRKILSGLIPKRRNAANHAVWEQKDLLFLCLWGLDDNKTIGIAHFEDVEHGLPRIQMISCAPSVEDFTQINVFEERLSHLAWPSDATDTAAWRDAWVSAFTTTYHQIIQDASTLTSNLAVEAQNIRNTILSILEVESPNGYVHLLYDKFKQTLIHDMTAVQFADMYAQTVVYGLFSARCMDTTPEGFSAAEAIDCIPSTNPFLKSLMQECLGAEKNSKLSFDELEVGNVTDLLLHSNTDAIIQDFNRQTGGGREDPVIHFYEEFLTKYDKTQKVQRGVFYTPQPVVNFIVKAVDQILKESFGLIDGLASDEMKTVKIKRQSKKKIEGLYRLVEDTTQVPAVQVLDPATGTGTFIRQVILQIYDNFAQAHSNLDKSSLKRAWNEYVPKQLLPRLNAFELMMAPYAVAHMKLAMVLNDTGYEFADQQRLQVYLTNTLEESGSSDLQPSLFDDPLALESVEANSAKKNKGINVVIGNPPYSGESANKNPWIMSLMEDYKMEPGGVVRLNERNPKWLNDDYVKFIRYAQRVVDVAGNGIVAYINPHGFISNPTFRGMRWKLMQSFDEIYILDLHGNSNRKESCPDGGKDENVFDIQQGVCICIFVKKSDKPARSQGPCKVFHADLFGTRSTKYTILNQSNLSDIDFREVVPREPDYLFHAVDYSLRDEYEKGFAVTELFEKYSVGIVTARDGLTIGFTPEEVAARAVDFASLEPEVAREKYALGKDVRDWKVQWAQDDIKSNALSAGSLRPETLAKIAYRPFDYRYTVFTGSSRGFICYPRDEVMGQFIGKMNIGLATARSNKSDDCDHFYVTDCIMEAKCAERSTQSALFPLYTYYLDSPNPLVNYDPSIIERFESSVSASYRHTGQAGSDEESTFNEVDVFDYVYGILFSKSYRDRFSDFLKADYPRIPYPVDQDFFSAVLNYGRQIRNLHLMCESVELEEGISFNGVDGVFVERIKYKDGCVFINRHSCFTGVSRDDWDFGIGGYKPLQRWFKDRKGRNLSNEEIEHYQQVIEVIKRTDILMRKIDEVVKERFSY